MIGIRILPGTPRYCSVTVAIEGRATQPVMEPILVPHGVTDAFHPHL